MSRILVADDDPALLRVLRIALGALGYEVDTAMTGNAALSEAALRSPDAIVLDLGLPDLDGVEVCRRIREWSEVPIVVLSADGTESRKVEALDSGADDYMTKPFGMNELQARLRVALRHGSGRGPGSGEAGEPAELDAGPLHLDLVHHEVTMSGRAVELTRREFAFLAYLARYPGHVCTHRMILESVWGPQYRNEARYLREYAYRVRRKLGDDEGHLIRTHAGIGYELVVSSEGSTGRPA